MKSLKRTLSLVLSLVMVLGLFGGISMTAAATDFTDDSKIQYNEAVDVMTAIGEINGFEDGTFNPEGYITRAQAAKLVAYTILGEEAAGNLKGVSTKFSDVPSPQYDWAIPSIVYLTDLGVINGAGGDKFAPEENIEGYAILKMLLCAIGYGAKSEYTGDSWRLNVAIDASKESNQLTKGLASGVTQSGDSTREQVALYCFNAIQASKVRYLSALDTYIQDTGALAGGTQVTIMSSVYPTLDVDKAADGTGSNTGVDDLGNPANVWTLNNKTIGKYGKEATLTFTTEQSTQAVTAALKGFKVKDGAGSGINIMRNGTPLNTATKDVNLIANVKTETKDGVIVNIYSDKAGVIYSITSVGTEIAEVTSVNAATGEVTLTVPAGANKVSATATGTGVYTIAKTNDLYPSVSGLKKDDKVGVVPSFDGVDHNTPGNASAAQIVPLTEVEGPITKVTRNPADNANTKITVDGTEYPVSAYAATAAKSAGVNAQADATLWLDPNGFVLDCKAVAASVPAQAFLLAQTDEINSDKVLVHNAEVIWPDGTTSTIPLGTNDARAQVGKLCDVDAPDSNGNYKLKAITPDTASGTTDIADKNKAIPLKTSSGKIDATDKTLDTDSNGDGSNLFINKFAADVKFIYINTQTNTFEVLTGVQKVDPLPSDADKAWATTVEVEDVGGAKENVVNAVFLVGVTPDGVSDDVKIAYFPSTKVLSTEMMGETKVSRYTAYIDGVKFDGGLPVLNKDDVAANSFFTVAESKTIPGAYAISPFSDTDKIGTLTGSICDYGVGVFGIDTNTDGNAEKSLTGASAAVVDLRNSPTVTVSTPEALATLVATDNVTVDVIYSKTSNTAIAFYVTAAADKPTISVTVAAGADQKLTLNGNKDDYTTSATAISLTPTTSDGSSPGSYTYAWTITKSGETTPAATASTATYTPDIYVAGTYTVSVTVGAPGCVSGTAETTLTIS